MVEPSRGAARSRGPTAVQALMPFMLDIDASRAAPLEQLALDYLGSRQISPTLDFCRRVAAVEAPELQVARRLGVAVSTVRGWREVGRRCS